MVKAYSSARTPSFRKLRAYAFDPSLSLKLDTLSINCLVYKVPWEHLDPGPCGEYVEVIDFDPTIKQLYAPVDLNSSYILAESGLDPSESNPQFHQQMAYAVAMTTITNFEKALGRKVLWARRRVANPTIYEEYVQHLRIYPHALREANAYYSPVKKALLFGYFSATPAAGVVEMPDATVFTCLSHDIIAHEVTHAILDGMHYFYNEPTNPDVLAFHEAFADIVALFQHFTFPEVLKHQIAQTKGNLASQNLLGQLAQQFGSAVGGYGSLRDAIGSVNHRTKEWEPKEPVAEDYIHVLAPHKRGSILVAAVFEAFINIYKRRITDLLRIATKGTGILPQGDLHPDLVNRLASEAATAAQHVLNMCIRALDYCPPIDITFGDYLRAVITADVDLVPEDTRGYRVAFIDAFRRRGIFPANVKTLSVDSLRYKQEHDYSASTHELFGSILAFLTEYRKEVLFKKDRKQIFEITRKYVGGDKTLKGLHKHIISNFEDSLAFEQLTGLMFSQGWTRFGIRTSHVTSVESPSYQVQNLRMISRTGPDGNQVNQIMFSIIQRCGVIIRDGLLQEETFVPDDEKDDPDYGFQFRGGCTMIFDLDTLELKYCISKPLLDPEKLDAKHRMLNAQRILKQYRYQWEDGPMSLQEYSLYFGAGLDNQFLEPFAFLHQH